MRILLKEITPDTFPVLNHTRHEWPRWDAFILVSDPDALFAEFQSRGLGFHETLADTEDGLRAFELKDHDGYVLCFGNRFEWKIVQIANYTDLRGRSSLAPAEQHVYSQYV